MLLDLLSFDIFGFISGFFVIVFVIAIIFFIIVILIVYKLLHTNVDNVNKKSRRAPKVTIENPINDLREKEKEQKIEEKSIYVCKFCGENIEENITYCPYCGSDLTT